jgi:hypothetical protein
MGGGGGPMGGGNGPTDTDMEQSSTATDTMQQEEESNITDGMSAQPQAMETVDNMQEQPVVTGQDIRQRQLYAGPRSKQQKYGRDDGRGMVMTTKPGQYKQPSGVEREGERYDDGVLEDEYEYNDYNILPMADHDTGSFEYGYSFLPPDKWYPQPPNPPICVTDKRLHVMPIYTTGTPIDVKEWNDARRVTPPDNIKTKYIKEKLNSGR